ncbi:PepSY domain-containing protein [Neobacillus niacini]|uniref:PepSY domain-containing protein n=1 Tax=Neobacillus niacini TaxID=86668 RepID=UPI002FFF37B7
MKKIAVIVLLILILGTIIWYGGTKMFNRAHSIHSEDMVSQMMIEKYGGTIKNISPDQENYKLTLVKDQILYDIIVNRRTGEVVSFVKQSSPVTNDSRQSESKEPQKGNQPATSADTPITIAKAEELALEKVSGTITSIKLDKEDDQLVYEVDIDQSKTKKAEVIINAYSGKIESITFETDEDN